MPSPAGRWRKPSAIWRNAAHAVDIVHQPGDIVENDRKVRIELAFHGCGPSADCWRFDVYLIHYLDVERMPAV